MAADLATTPTSGLTVQLGGDAHLSNFGAVRVAVARARVRPERLRRDAARARGSGTSSGWRRASSSRRVISGSAGRRARAATAPAVKSYRTAMARFGAIRLPRPLVRAHDGRERRRAAMDSAPSASSGSPASSAARGRRPACRRSRSWPRTSTVGTASARSPPCSSRCATSRRSTTRPRSRPRPRGVRALQADAVGRSPRAARPLHPARRRREGRRRRQRRHALPGHAARRPRPRRPAVPPDQGSAELGARGVPRTERLCQPAAGASSRGSGSSRPSPTSSSDGPRAASNTGTSTCASSATGRARSRSRAPPSTTSRFYAQLCGMTLARGHARSGDAVAIADYMGKSDTFDRAITDFSEAYEAQNRERLRGVPRRHRGRPAPRERQPRRPVKSERPLGPRGVTRGRMGERSGRHPRLRRPSLEKRRRPVGWALRPRPPKDR